ncbi:BrnA antitoxin family protein [Rhizobium sp. TRM95111]|uniref:BrnA antitoxin family protein n=1 Tax=Rhizobium alarense TaxID=2846851 RepID=UPI001F298248|nr:BrnA antitoxin family protein [Rhizobium alarense]MCF3638556.1 BrnA antitoxin family protein [Rhizobium alarense]
MTGSRKPSANDWIDPEDAPDLSEAPWRERIAAAPLRRGRPRREPVKTSTTIRLDTDLIAHFRAGGPGWQSRINAALRQWLEQQRT